jgi:NAD(P)-dependent dehydrogenase (short-subunit alcohol dehydrogenase family)
LKPILLTVQCETIQRINNFIASQTALGRVGLPDDIGGAIASLLSEDNRWVNAQRIEVSGGMFL